MAQAIKKRIQVQVNRKLADEGDAVLDRLGLNPTTAITMFYKRLVAEGGLPFSTKLTQREKDELAIQELTENWPTEELDTPEKIKKWIKKDE
ncbi:MAG: type II toxin-antitoxin system RelB/DinJ family antitoxin [Limosilactobacillus sp.]|jgi:DNA-damage-inducible protein J|uniref:type II toxin-antitoxin system RelB/DinJ family antitoxin n=1 Tax=Limosilactobacillus sp. TaxID=2773925 RepID=UPI0025BE0FFF|nr:type II toxin-antitoxin system RelB/DinJ family antitoxin [Limosilactobacillus sp.]MCI1974498.1 type II toxin-antitoxin system RelB/DinJ family antitoxin [Limosilactobacillus sp.]MCI2030649.1 type II toxin-antitoxin system RelB/DinJ family antitoxin [Limosilactobacillus sp.]